MLVVVSNQVYPCSKVLMHEVRIRQFCQLLGPGLMGARWGTKWGMMRT